MTCPRCQGLMIYDSVYCGEQVTHISFQKCLNCGFLTDPYLQHVRLQQLREAMRHDEIS
jgi:hypothetical protein